MEGELNSIGLVPMKLRHVLEGGVAGEGLKERLTKAPHIGRVGIGHLGLAEEREADRFRRHEAWCSLHSRRPDHRFLPFAQAEVAELDPPVLWRLGFDEDILEIV
jgi:hypothetical protein